MSITASDILTVTRSVTKNWTKQRRAEERGSRSALFRDEIFCDTRFTFSRVADEILPAAYDHASGGGHYSLGKRQLYYACREEFKLRTGRELDSNYFSHTLLVQYLNRHPETCSWKITADPRGTLSIPNAEYDVRIPCGTLQIEEHLQEACAAVDPIDFADAGLPIEWPSLRHGQRYQGVLFIEKEGFQPMLEEARIAERFDVAILSCKGQSVVAARQFIDTVCSRNGGVQLFVVHDCDKWGFEISQRLTRVSEWAEANDRVTYRFQNEINVTDLGLRLADVKKYGLAEETVEYKGGFASDSITTAEERDFLRSGRRVELNAFTSPQFIEWLESKLTAHGLGNRLIPEDEVIQAAYRRAVAVASINAVIADAVADAEQTAADVKIPKSIRRQLQKAMQLRPEAAWDTALYHLVQDKFEKDEL